MKNIKHVRLCMAALLLLAMGVTSACGDSEAGKTDVVTDAATGGVTEAVTEEDPALKDNLPERDFGGYEYKIYTRGCCAGGHKDGVWQLEESGEIVDDAVFARNKAVEDRFNVVIREPEMAENEDISVLTNSLMAGDAIADLAIHHFRFLGDLALQQLCADANTLEYLDFEKPWWNTYLIKNYSIFDKYFVINGTVNVDNITEVSVILFNKTLTRNQLDVNFYDLVNEGKWTIDKMTEIVKSFGADLNGDGKIEFENDELAFTGNAGFMFQFQVAMDQPTTQINDAGEPELCINTEKMANIVNKMYDMVCAYDYSVVNNDAGSQAFLDGRALFHVDKITSCVSAQFREMEDDYGIIPLPKYDEAQETYFSHASAHADCFAIPVINEDFERCSIILEAMAAEGYKTIRPAVYDVAIKQKGARDEDSAKMIDLIYNGRTGDFADLYDEWGLVYTLDHMIGRQQSNTWASYYKSNENASVKRLAKAVEVFSSFE